MPVVISERALFARVARKLAHESVFLHRCRIDSRGYADLGRYYCVNDRNHISGRILNTPDHLLEYGKELGVVAANEELAL